MSPVRCLTTYDWGVTHPGERSGELSAQEGVEPTALMMGGHAVTAWKADKQLASRSRCNLVLAGTEHADQPSALMPAE